MFSADVTDMEDAVVIHCRGRLVQSDAAFRLRNAVQANSGAHTIVLDFSELHAVEGGGLGMLAFLQRWAVNNGIRLKLLGPSTTRVRQSLKQLASRFGLSIEVEDQSNVLSLVGSPKREYWIASNMAA